ncbi:hypothetical protein MNZ22_00555 [Aeromonas encheleia]|uniref:hypothetical protein n=1 Tax=Aeromonas encheleia TaxID=73010 RepID=UPI001F5AB947|nr:hypothetical protein [Aeromonas encheleia]UNP89047.1 hypothetical protein MNZ22_00555 [Aeromonas encheleia]
MKQIDRSVQVWYEKYANLIKIKDVTGISQLLGRGFKSIPPAGNTFSKMQYISEITREFSEYDYPQVTINVVKVREGESKLTAYVEKSLVSYDSKKRRYDSKILSRETLRTVDGSFQIIEVDTISRELSIDGKSLTPKLQETTDAMCQQCGNPSRD